MDELAPWLLHKMENVFDKWFCFFHDFFFGDGIILLFYLMENEHIASVVMALVGIVSFI